MGRKSNKGSTAAQGTAAPSAYPPSAAPAAQSIPPPPAAVPPKASPPKAAPRTAAPAPSPASARMPAAAVPPPAAPQAPRFSIDIDGVDEPSPSPPPSHVPPKAASPPPAAGPAPWESAPKLYRILELTPDATVEDIKKAYKRRAKVLHPDRNRDDPDANEKFKELGEAQKILSDPKLREVYDRSGEEGLKRFQEMGGESRGRGPRDIFDLFMGGGGRSRGDDEEDGARKKAANTQHRLQVRLEDLYTGANLNLSIEKECVCPQCNGKGNMGVLGPQVCPRCGGLGVRMYVVEAIPGFLQRVRQPCNFCEGSGRFVDPSDICELCQGRKVVPQRATIEVPVDPGMADGDRVVIRGQGAQEAGCEPGDAIVVLHQIPHRLYTRHGMDLRMERSLTLVEALCGFSFNIPTLDGRTLHIASAPGEVIEPGHQRGIANAGMPRKGYRFEKGRLIITFRVVFPVPGQLTDPQRHVLATVLGRPTPAPLAPDMDEGALEPLERLPEPHEQARPSPQDAEGDDEEEGPPGVPVCTQS